MPETERTINEIEADIERTQHRLASNLEALKDRVSPSTVATNTAQKAKDLVTEKVNWAKRELIDEDGNLNLKKLAVVSGAIAGIAGFICVIRALRKRK
ncbi:MAG: DUF3618 domain-containing protein [Propionibacteriaceae bacterium]|jgi:hypothetical protein|nr:DUF3618 domain-containing protein [Propionibacteriaceae bacterium]